MGNICAVGLIKKVLFFQAGLKQYGLKCSVGNFFASGFDRNIPRWIAGFTIARMGTLLTDKNKSLFFEDF